MAEVKILPIFTDGEAEKDYNPTRGKIDSAKVMDIREYMMSDIPFCVFDFLLVCKIYKYRMSL